MRALTAQELALWRSVVRDVAPRQRSIASPDLDEPAGDAPKGSKKENAGAATSSSPSHVKAVCLEGSPGQLPSLLPLDARLRRRLTKGRYKIDAVLDLHGLQQQAAHSRIVDFLARSQDSGAKLVLVITGKGRSLTEGGVLKRSAPLWLEAAELRPFVLAVEEASPVHGGSGALYVRLRKPRLRES